MHHSVRKALLITILTTVLAQPLHASFGSKIAWLIGGCTFLGGYIALCSTDDYASSQKKTDNTITGGLIGAAAGVLCSLCVERTDQEELDRADEHYAEAQTLYNNTLKRFSAELSLASSDEQALKRIINGKHRGGLYRYLDYAERLRTTLYSLENTQATLHDQIKTLKKRNRKLRKRRSMPEQERTELSQHYDKRQEETTDLNSRYAALIRDLNHVLGNTQSLDGYNDDLTRKSLDDTRRELARTQQLLYEERIRPHVQVIHTYEPHHRPHERPYPDLGHGHHHDHCGHDHAH
jgi:hypothetical protein